LRRVAVCALLLAAFAALSPAGAAVPSIRIVEVAPGISLALPPAWSEAPRFYRNARELVRLPAERQAEAISAYEPEAQRTGVWTPRLMALVEEETNHAAAVRRLAGVVQENAKGVTYLTVQGWPAVSRRVRLELAPRPKSSARPIPAWVVTTAAAVGNRVVKLEARFPAAAGDAELAEAEAIGRQLLAAPGDAAKAEKDLSEVRKQAAAGRAGGEESAAPAPAPPAAPPPSGGGPFSPDRALGAGLYVQPGAETEMAASASGQYVVVASQNVTRASADGGRTFPSGSSMPFSNFGDPSLAWGQSGTFYLAGIKQNSTCSGANPTNGCHTGMARSTNNGQAFTSTTDAVVCPVSGAGNCFPDQEHIAADRVNAGTGSADQVYVVWRNFTSGPTPAIVCSSDGGTTWSAPVAVDTTGDWARVTVGGDGSVYVVYATSPPGTIFMHKYGSCTGGLTSAGSPVTVTAYNGVDCTTMPGLDRCNNRNTMASFTAAVDDTNSNHVYVTYANNTASGNENIVVRDSINGGAAWTGSATLNTGATARRFMPWSCALGGTLYVGWYDGRNATSGNNDRARYFRGSATGSGGSLTAGTEADVSGADDALCASGWPCAPDAQSNSESCSIQPQLAGICLDGSGNPTSAMNPQRCDFNEPPNCPGGFTCKTQRGCPKYGDYTGTACGGGLLFFSWASATPPAGVIGAPPAGINTFVAAARIASPDLATTLMASPSPVIAGQNITYTIGVQNKINNGLAQQVQVVDVLPPGTTFQSSTAPGWSCVTPSVGSGGTVTCTLPALAAGAAASNIVLIVRAPDAIVPALADTATVSSNAPDANPADNTATATIAVVSPSDVTASKALTSTGPYPQYALVVYTITLHNAGPGAQFDNPGDELTDTLPATLQLLDAMASSGTVTTVGNTVSWNGKIAAGGNVTITIRASVVYASHQTISNQGTVHYDPTGVGTNSATRLSDDPSLPGIADPTTFVSASIAEVPALGDAAAAALTALLLAAGVYALRRRRAR
jgi:uncharacterized repeat protein (TIGR01451 family)